MSRVLTLSRKYHAISQFPEGKLKAIGRWPNYSDQLYVAGVYSGRASDKRGALQILRHMKTVLQVN